MGQPGGAAASSPQSPTPAVPPARPASASPTDRIPVLAWVIGAAVSEHRPVLGTRWPWLGAGIAAGLWAPNLIWQATHGWPQLAMASALHQQNTPSCSWSTRSASCGRTSPAAAG